MKTHPDTHELHDYAEGVLPDAGVARVERHLAACESCRDEVAWVRSLRARAADWVPDVEPERDLWPAIEARIREGARAPAASAEGGPADWRARRAAPRRPDFRRSRPWRTPSLLAAAALVVLAIGAAIGLGVSRLGPGGADDPGRTALPAATGGEGAAFASVPGEVEAAWEPTIRDLREVLDASRGALAPETVEVLEESLRIIDEAIREARTALEADPASQGAARTLNSMYEAKLQVLRTAVGLTRGA